MERLTIVILSLTATSLIQTTTRAEETVLSSILAPTIQPAELSRQSRSYYDYRYGRPYDRLVYDRPRCGRCDDDDDDDSDYDRDRSDERRSRPKNKPQNRFDDDRSVDDRKSQKNVTDDDSDNSSGERRTKKRNRHRYDDRDRYRLNYYDRFLTDRYRDRDYDRYYDDYRRPAYDRYPDRYDGYSGRYDYGYPGYRQPYYDRYDDSFGGYGPSDGRGPYGRPWDETYRGQSGWDAVGRGYYFASGRPDSAPPSAWGRPDYNRYQNDGWQSSGYSGGYTDPLEYRGYVGYGQNNGYRQDYTYGQGSGWRSVGERRPYRDESGVKNLDKKEYNRQQESDSYSQGSHLSSVYGQSNSIQPNKYESSRIYGQSLNYGQSNTYGQPSLYEQNGHIQSSTTQETSYLFQREDEEKKVKNESTDKPTAKVS